MNTLKPTPTKTISEYHRSTLNRLANKMSEASSYAFYNAFKNQEPDVYLFAYSSVDASRIICLATLEVTIQYIQGDIKKEIEQIINELKNVSQFEKYDYPTKFAYISNLLFKQSKHLKSILK